jgi:hypothetical protein
VVGTREVTEEVPDPEALAAVPKVTVTRTVEDVRWECRPLLAEAQRDASLAVHVDQALAARVVRPLRIEDDTVVLRRLDAQLRDIDLPTDLYLTREDFR